MGRKEPRRSKLLGEGRLLAELLEEERLQIQQRRLALTIEGRVKLGQMPVLDRVPEDDQKLKVLALGWLTGTEVLPEALG